MNRMMASHARQSPSESLNFGSMNSQDSGIEQNKNALLEFGPFQADPQAGLLLRDGEVIPLPPKAFEVLLVLLRNQGRGISRDELTSAVWPNMFVEEANLTQAISVLRKALGEDAQEPRYIVTLPRRGYRFSAPVRMARLANVDPATRARPGRRWSRIAAMVAGCGVVAA